MVDGDSEDEAPLKVVPNFGQSDQSTELLAPTMPGIAEEDSDIFSQAGDMDMSMRLMTENRKSWQKRGIMIFESFYYMLTRYVFIFITFLFSSY